MDVNCLSFALTLAAQSSLDSGILWNDRWLWAEEVGKSLAQLLTAEPTTSLGTHFTAQPLHAHNNETTPCSPAPENPLAIPCWPLTSLPGVTWLPSPLRTAFNPIVSGTLHLTDPDFPPHADSFLAELLTMMVASHSPLMPASTFLDPLPMLETLRQRSGAMHSWHVLEMPTMFSYAQVVLTNGLGGDPRMVARDGAPIRVVQIRFGVSAPQGNPNAHAVGVPHHLGAAVRRYRTHKAWGRLSGAAGDGVAPKPTEPWNHGHCAEMQAIPPAVEWCKIFGLENVFIYSLSLYKSGNQTAPMCSNCRTYVRAVLKRHPSWRVVDVHTGLAVS
ncbi:hypothetical protein NMY22_g4069 [Coprinellus aureogranulatus]|nr:hypothetical protein NMY22_g4069 [Coprinellus aureogranulatus]